MNARNSQQLTECIVPLATHVYRPKRDPVNRRIHREAIHTDGTFTSYCDCSIAFDPMFTEGNDLRTPGYDRRKGAS